MPILFFPCLNLCQVWEFERIFVDISKISAYGRLNPRSANWNIRSAWATTILTSQSMSNRKYGQTLLHTTWRKCWSTVPSSKRGKQNMSTKWISPWLHIFAGSFSVLPRRKTGTTWCSCCRKNWSPYGMNANTQGCRQLISVSHDTLSIGQPKHLYHYTIFLGRWEICLFGMPQMCLRPPTLAYGEAGHPVFAIFPAVSLMLMMLT